MISLFLIYLNHIFNRRYSSLQRKTNLRLFNRGFLRMNTSTRIISDDLLNNFLPCRKCGNKPIIEDSWGFDYRESFIRCPNDCCHNSILFDEKLSKMAIKWNKINENIYVPKEKPHQIKQSCYYCKRKQKCQNVLGENNNYKKLHVCSEFLNEFAG